jgi:polyribonucleotide nucleotidyltransferase
LEDFGAFVEIMKGKEGLVHVSEIAHTRTNSARDVLKIGEVVKVKLKEIDKMGRINLSIKELLPKTPYQQNNDVKNGFMNGVSREQIKPQMEVKKDPLDMSGLL